MIRSSKWTSRTWSFTLPVGVFPALVERLRGTAARAVELTAGVDDSVLRHQPSGEWSAKQHIGHLDDLHELDERRLHEFLSRVNELTAADMTNRRTHEASHNDTPVAALIARFRANRQTLVDAMDKLTADEIAIAATHPRLKQPLRLIDWAMFVAEHDDHHLAAVRQAIHDAR